MLNIVNITTIPTLLDLLAPHSCRGCGAIGNALCNRCRKHIIDKHQNFCPVCKQPTTNGLCSSCIDLPPSFIGGERSGLLDVIIHDYKYQSIRALANPLASIMLHALPSPQSPSYVVPLPTINLHIRQRGFDHMKLIAKHLDKLSKHRYIYHPILTRCGNTTQVGQNRSTRIKQANSAYQLSAHFSVNPNATYLLLDDVWTTGASMRACIKKLQQAGARNLMLAILALSRLS